MTSPKGSRTKKRFNIDNEFSRWRKGRGISQYEAADLFGITQPHYSMIENEKCKPSRNIRLTFERLRAGKIIL